MTDTLLQYPSFARLYRAFPYEECAQSFTDFIRGDRNAKLLRFLYQDDFIESGMELWDDALGAENPYYIFPNEADLLDRVAGEIAQIVQTGLPYLELGVGSNAAVEKKTKPLIRAIKPQKVVVNDLSYTSVTTAKKMLLRQFPGLDVKACEADFLDPRSAVYSHYPANIVMTGSIVSNLASYNGHIPVNEAADFLRTISRLMGEEGSLIITQDTNNDESSLKAAYNTPQLQRFREAALWRIKAYLNIPSFDPEALRHEMVWEPESRLLADTFVNMKDQFVHLGRDVIHIPKGRRLYLANCYKYPVNDFVHISHLAGLRTIKTWMDAEGRVALHVLKTA